jgi:hypothetical protein
MTRSRLAQTELFVVIPRPKSTQLTQCDRELVPESVPGSHAQTRFSDGERVVPVLGTEPQRGDIGSPPLGGKPEPTISEPNPITLGMGMLCDDCGRPTVVALVTDYGSRYCRECVFPTAATTKKRGAA